MQGLMTDQSTNSDIGSPSTTRVDECIRGRAKTENDWVGHLRMLSDLHFAADFFVGSPLVCPASSFEVGRGREKCASTRTGKNKRTKKRKGVKDVFVCDICTRRWNHVDYASIPKLSRLKDGSMVQISAGPITLVLLVLFIPTCVQFPLCCLL